MKHDRTDVMQSTKHVYFVKRMMILQYHLLHLCVQELFTQSEQGSYYWRGDSQKDCYMTLGHMWVKAWLQPRWNLTNQMHHCHSPQKPDCFPRSLSLSPSISPDLSLAFTLPLHIMYNSQKFAWHRSKSYVFLVPCAPPSHSSGEICYPYPYSLQ